MDAKILKNCRTNAVKLYIETWSQFVNKKRFINEMAKLVNVSRKNVCQWMKTRSCVL